jgi:DNA-binding transcriptional MocR family regulator
MSSDKFSKLSWHKRTHGHDFTGAEFRVLMAVFDYSDENGRKSHPGLKRLMTDTGYGKTAVSEALTALQARGWITQTRKGSGTSGKTSVYELVPDAPSSAAEAVPPETGASAAGADQPTEVGPAERTSWSAGADLVVPLERTPTDPGSDPGSDPLESDQGEVRYPPNHLDDQDETGLESRSLADAGSGEAAEYRPAGLQSPWAGGGHGCRHNPFCDNPSTCNCEQLAVGASA